MQPAPAPAPADAVPALDLSAPAPAPILPSPAPLSLTLSYRPFYSPYELQALIRLQAGSVKTQDGWSVRVEMSSQRVEMARQLACGYIDRVGARLGFPRRTIATAQTLYHRFHLHHPLADYHHTDVSISSLLSAAKLEDTLKKLRDIQVAAWAVSNLLEGGTGLGEGDAQHQEAQRPKLIAIERYILETLCFNLHPHKGLKAMTNAALAGVVKGESEVAGATRDVFGWVMRLGRAMEAPKPFVYLSHLLAVDVHRTTAPLAYPSHTVALACVYLATFLTPGHANCAEWKGETVTEEMRTRAPVLGGGEGWANEWESEDGDVREVCHALLDLFILLCPPSLAHTARLPPTASPSVPPSPLSAPSPAEPAPPPHSHTHPSAPTSTRDREKEKTVLSLGVPHALALGLTLPLGPGGAGIAARSEDDFTRIKIRLRAAEMDAAATRERGKRPLGEDGAELPVDAEEEARRGALRWRGAEKGLAVLDEKRGEVAEEEDTRRREEAEMGERQREREKERQRARRPVSVRYLF